MEYLNNVPTATSANQHPLNYLFVWEAIRFVYGFCFVVRMASALSGVFERLSFRLSHAYRLFATTKWHSAGLHDFNLMFVWGPPHRRQPARIIWILEKRFNQVVSPSDWQSLDVIIIAWFSHPTHRLHLLKTLLWAPIKFRSNQVDA